ncbi:unnamed protein product [Cuscuta epithymum]|uniref:Uncharacterized protein n=1 Tax=Cuscuta epithymum TaxID=186058 RepID=A0AAV0DV76_9ASTE|nr:unnamed protein product [Cuscuta epithymum]
MDKNKTRTDLLAAGRKKLQQFRQKNKGSKSSGKHSRSGSDAQHIPGAEGPLDCSNHEMSLSEWHTIEDTVDSSTNRPSVDELEAGGLESSARTKELEMQTEASVYAEDPCKVELSETLAEDLRFVSSEPVPVESEEKPTKSAQHEPDDLVNSGNNSKSLAPRVDKEMQHGIEQEPYNPDPEQVDAKSEVEIVVENTHCLNKFGAHVIDHATPVVGEGGVTREKNETNHPIETDDVTLSTIGYKDAEERDVQSIPLEPLHEGVATVSPLVVCSRTEGVSQIHCVSTDCDGGHVQRVNSYGSFDKEKNVEFSSVQSASSINLSQLADVVRRLDDDEFKSLFMSRDSAVKVLMNAETLFASSSTLFDVFERMKEQLYLASLVKDVKSVQLIEESELQISEVNASVNQLEDKNGKLANELEQVRSELKVVIAEKEELRELFQISKTEVVDLSARVDELQIRLNMSKEDLDNLSAELATCKNLVSAFEAEKENLGANLDLLSEENKKLQDERGSFVTEIEKLGMELAQCKNSFLSLHSENQDSNENLTFLNAERCKLEMEKEYFVCENDKLLAEVADCKKTIEALHAEKTNSNELLKSVTEESKKLLEEKHSLLNDSVNLEAELSVSKVSIEALQKEVFDKSTHMTSLMEEINKLHNEKQQLLIKNEELLQELTESKDLSAHLQAQCSVAVDDLKCATLRKEELAEENLHLSRSLELQKSKIKEFESQSKSPSQSKEAGSLSAGAHCAVQGEDSVTDGDGSSRFSSEGDCVNSFSRIHNISSDYMQNGLLQFQFIKKHLDEAESVLTDLEKTVEVIHAHSARGEVITPRISKLIQAFESKGHMNDNLSEDQHPSENHLDADPCVLSKKQILNLHGLLKNILLESQNACKLFEGEMRNNIEADTMVAELKAKHESLVQHSDLLEQTNMALMILNETLAQCISNAKSKEGDFRALYESLQNNQATLITENDYLREELNNHHTRTGYLQHQLTDMQQSCNKMVASSSNQVEALKKEVADRESIREEEWNSLVAEVMEKLSKLDSSTVTASSSLLAGREGFDRLGLISHIAYSVDNAIKLIDALQEQSEAAVCSFNEINKRFDVLQAEKEMVVCLIYRVYRNLVEIVDEMPDQVGDAEITTNNERPADPFLPGVFDTLLEQLRKLNSARLQLEPMHSELTSEMDKSKESEELNKCFFDSDSMLKCVGFVESVIALDGVDINVDQPAIFVQSLTHFLVQKYKDAIGQAKLLTESDASKEKQIINLQKQTDELSLLCTQLENENFILKESLRKLKEDAAALHSQLNEKVSDTEQLDQRVASLREKLSIAVSRGKSLIVQRDGLKQSLADTSSELEKLSQELHLKDSRLHELEMKLKTCSEDSERMEALEFELSYIRNSATALRESFLLKDSVLQRIEEVLEDLELPEHFHSQGILEKIDWLAKSVSANSVHLTDWDQKSAVGGSYSDGGTGVMDGWKEDTQQSLNSLEDLRVKYEDLQNKFYRLAEQNEMLEQSLVERNNLIHHWEAILDTIEMPSQLRSVEPNDKIGWVAFALSEAQNYCNSLQQKSDNFETLFEESNRRLSELEASFESTVNEKEAITRMLETVTCDNEKLSEKAAQFATENNKMQNEISFLQEKLAEMLGIEEHIHHISGEIKRLQNLVRDAIHDDVTDDQLLGADGIKYLEQSLRTLIHKYTELSFSKAVDEVAAVEHVLLVDGTESEQGTSESRYAEDRKMGGDVGDRLCLEEERASFVENNQSVVSEIEALNKKNELLELLHQEELKNQSLVSKVEALTTNKKELHELLSQEELKNQSLVSKVEALNVNMEELQVLHSQQELKNHSLVSEAESLNMKIIELQQLLSHQELKNQSLVAELEALNMNKKELQEHLSQEELKSASLREKLNVAVRKGKSLVQQRDSLKQSIEELNIDLENLKSKLKLQETVISDFEQMIKDQSVLQEKMKSIESDNVLLRSRLAETECSSQEKDHILANILNIFNGINLSALSSISSPIEKAKHVSSVFQDLQSALTSSEQEAIKSKRAADLLLAELNEVQERNDGLQEELENALSEVSRLSKEMGYADSAKNEAIENFEKLFAAHSEERQHQLAEFVELKASIEQLKVDLSVVRSSFRDVLSNYLEILHNVGANLNVFSESSDALTSVALMGTAVPFCTFSITTENKAFVVELSSIREMLDEHSQLVYDEARHITESFGRIQEEITLQKQLFDSMKKDMTDLKCIGKEKDSELLQMRRYSSLLYEACTSAVYEIENGRSQFFGNDSVFTVPRSTSVSWNSVGDGWTRDNNLFSEDTIRSVCERLLIAVKDLVNMQMELVEVNRKDNKAAMSNLQKELQQKDIQGEKICRELVRQIKEAEAVSSNYLQELQLEKVQVHDLQRYVKLMEEEQTKLEDKIKELQDQGASLAEAQNRVEALEGMIAAKEQENEALMQALDEEEAQMEDMSAKIDELERVLAEKNKDVERLEVSRGKALKKLSVTVSKFDELHHLSENLLSEVVSLQSQLHERDGEVSFLRQEVTRCTNDALALSQTSSKQNSAEIYGLLTWLDKTISGLQESDAILDKAKVNHVHEYQESLQKQLLSIVSELEGLRAATQSKDLLLEVEKAKVKELSRKEDILENSLHEKDAQLAILRAGDPRHVTSTSSEVVEIEPLNNKWVQPGSVVTSQVRSLRKSNNDHIAIAVDANPVGGEFEDEDDDKAHGFKSLTTSRIVPRFTRPLTNMVDGLWVSCDRALMRQPALRLGLILYWAVLHALLAAFVV